MGAGWEHVLAIVDVPLPPEGRAAWRAQQAIADGQREGCLSAAKGEDPAASVERLQTAARLAVAAPQCQAGIPVLAQQKAGERTWSQAGT